MEMRVVDGTIWLAVLVALCGLPAEAGAVELYEDDEQKLTVGANLYVGAVAGAEISTDRPDRYGLELSLARVTLQADYADRATLAVQLGGATGDVVLKDAVAALHPTESLSLRMGRYKMSVSDAYLMSAADLPFVGRTLLNTLVPNRAIGAEAVGTFEAGDAEIQANAGVFQPPRTTFAAPQGQLLSGRVQVTLPSEVKLHAAYAHHTFAENELPGEPGRRAFEFQQPLDVAVGYKNDTWNLHLEGVAVFDPPGRETAWGGYAHAQYTFGDEEELQYQPGVGYDVLIGEEDLHRATVGVNTFWWGTGFETLLDYRLLFDTTAGTETHSVFLNLRGKL